MKSFTLIAGVFIALFLAACGGGDDAEVSPTATQAASSQLPSSSPTSAPSTATLTPVPTATTGPVPTAEPGPAVLEVRVTDAPDPEITAVLIVASAIQVHNGTTGEWSTVVEGPVDFDLIQVAGIEDLLGESELEPATYTQIRLQIDSVTITRSGEDHVATVPSGELKLVGSMELEEGATTIATLDFDAEQSVVAQG